MARHGDGHPSGFLSGSAHPESLRLWLVVVRNTLGWSVAETAERTEVAADVIVRLEATGEPLNDDDDDCLCGLATDYEKALHELATAIDARFRHAWTSTMVKGLTNFCGGPRGDWNLPLARRIRQRQAELGLTLEEVAARTGGVLDLNAVTDCAFDGELNDYDDAIRALAAALELPFLELRILAERGQITPDDVDTWVRWRDERGPKNRRAA